MPRITLAAPYTDGDGKKHKADTTVTVDRGEASRLKFLGLARNPDPQPEPSKKAEPSASTKKES